MEEKLQASVDPVHPKISGLWLSLTWSRSLWTDRRSSAGRPPLAWCYEESAVADPQTARLGKRTRPISTDPTGTHCWPLTWPLNWQTSSPRAQTPDVLRVGRPAWGNVWSELMVLSWPDSAGLVLLTASRPLEKKMLNVLSKSFSSSASATPWNKNRLKAFVLTAGGASSSSKVGFLKPSRTFFCSTEKKPSNWTTTGIYFTVTQPKETEQSPSGRKNVPNPISVERKIGWNHLEQIKIVLMETFKCLLMPSIMFSLV